MKTNFFILFLVYSFFGVSNGNNPLVSGTLFFRENKGQVSDQNLRARPDVLFSGADGQLAFHLRRNGISYQLSKTTSLPSNKISEEDFDIRKLGLSAITASATLQRIDINWLNCNSKAEIEQANAINGYENFYSEVCPNGVLNVRSYKEVTYKNLYPGIDLKWYEKDGQLKYDYLVAAGADYKAIVLEINGAEKIFIDTNGALCFSTILGDIYENAPLVIQAGKILKAKWVLENNMATYSIEGINHNLPFTIDPIVRLWGTYYGGNGPEWAGRSVLDLSNNIFMCGGTISNNALTIATSGAHQTTLTPGTTTWNAPLHDAYIVKFDASGVRLWATYYGGFGNDFATACAVDSNGDVYITGNTTTTTTAVIATPGTHQQTFGGSTSNQFIGDAYITKFNSSGVRQWGSYFGGVGDEMAFKIKCDANNNIYIVGETSSGNPNSIASPGAHQIFLSGAKDGFIAKFTSNGTRLWSTYYGGAEYERIESCTVDIFDNLIVVGSTSSTQSISTAGCHQINYGGGSLNTSQVPGDAFIVKFNSFGTRLWGSYYGGSGAEVGNDISSDSLANIYISGTTSTGTSTIIATLGSHQSIYAGGSDAMFVKFDSQGVRQWGSYYGGIGQEIIHATTSCYVDNQNASVYFAGGTNNAASTGISTHCAYQYNYGGGTHDAFLTKFSLNGQRYWGTYYGGSGAEYASSLSGDSFGNIYLTGISTINTGTVISSGNAHQSIFGGGSEDAFLVKFSPCASVAPSNISVPKMCAGTETVLSSNESCLLKWYSDSTLTNLVYSGTSFSTGILNSDTSYFIVDVSCGVPSEKAIVTITVVPSPTITAVVSPSQICMGESAIIIPSGADTYKWIHTPSNYSVIVYPLITYTYVVTGTSTDGCKSTLPIAVFVSDCLNISERNNENYFSFYPNPSDGSITIQTSREMKISLMNELGVKVKEFGIIPRGTSKMNFEGIAQGLYFLNARSEVETICKKIMLKN